MRVPCERRTEGIQARAIGIAANKRARLTLLPRLTTWAIAFLGSPARYAKAGSLKLLRLAAGPRARRWFYPHNILRAQRFPAHRFCWPLRRRSFHKWSNGFCTYGLRERMNGSLKPPFGCGRGKNTILYATGEPESRKASKCLSGARLGRLL